MRGSDKEFVVTSVTRKKSPNVCTSCLKMISLEKLKILKSCPKSKKSPDLVTLVVTHGPGHGTVYQCSELGVSNKLSWHPLFFFYLFVYFSSDCFWSSLFFFLEIWSFLCLIIGRYWTSTILCDIMSIVKTRQTVT